MPGDGPDASRTSTNPEALGSAGWRVHLFIMGKLVEALRRGEEDPACWDLRSIHVIAELLVSNLIRSNQQSPVLRIFKASEKYFF